MCRCFTSPCLSISPSFWASNTHMRSLSPLFCHLYCFHSCSRTYIWYSSFPLPLSVLLVCKLIVMSPRLTQQGNLTLLQVYWQARDPSRIIFNRTHGFIAQSFFRFSSPHLPMHCLIPLALIIIIFLNRIVIRIPLTNKGSILSRITRIVWKFRGKFEGEHLPGSTLTKPDVGVANVLRLINPD